MYTKSPLPSPLINLDSRHSMNQVNPTSHNLLLFKSMCLVNPRTFTTVMLPKNASLRPQLMILRLLWLRILHLISPLLRKRKFLPLLLRSHLLSRFQKSKRLITAELSLRTQQSSAAFRHLRWSGMLRSMLKSLSTLVHALTIQQICPSRTVETRSRQFPNFTV